MPVPNPKEKTDTHHVPLKMNIRISDSLASSFRNDHPRLKLSRTEEGIIMQRDVKEDA